MVYLSVCARAFCSGCHLHVEPHTICLEFKKHINYKLSVESQVHTGLECGFLQLKAITQQRTYFENTNMLIHRQVLKGESNLP